MLGALMLKTAVPDELLLLDTPGFPRSAETTSPTLGKAVTRASTFHPSRTGVLASSSMAIHLAAVHAIRGSSGHRLSDGRMNGPSQLRTASV